MNTLELWKVEPLSMLYFLVDPPVAVMVIVPSVPALQEMLVETTAVTEMAADGWVMVTDKVCVQPLASLAVIV